MRRASFLFVCLLATTATVVDAQTSYPMLTRIEPTAAQRGKTTEIAVAGAGSFAGAWQVLCEPDGLSGEIIPEAEPNKTDATKGRRRGRATAATKAKLTVASNAPLGPREIRIATPQGVSSVGSIVIVDDPVVPEADDTANDQPESAQLFALPSVLTGAIGKPEDVDWYKLEVKASQCVTFSVWANRLEDKIHDLQQHFDPIVSIHDAQGREIAVDDNHDFADPRLIHTFKEAGIYYLQIRDTTYAGNRDWTYALHATAGPVATAVFPMVVNPGTKTTLAARGVNFDHSRPLALDVPQGLARGTHLLALPTPEGPTLPVPLVVTTTPILLEAGDAQTSTVRSQPIELPVAVCGRLDQPNDIDGYRFTAKKGQRYQINIIARRAGAATDPVLQIRNLKDGSLAKADDSPESKDPELEWTAPTDGLYALLVSDLHNRGGEEFGYVLEVTAAEPDFTLTCDPDKINVGPGARVPLFVQLTRRAGFNGPVSIHWEGLPNGVSASPLTIPASMTQGVSIVSATPEAKPTASLIAIKGRGESTHGTIERSAHPKQEIYFPGGGRGLFGVETIALTVTKPSDVTVEAKPAAITLAPGTTATIDVTVARHGGYDKGVNLAVEFQHLGGIFANPLPPGVVVKEAGSKTLLGPTETTGKIVLEAKPNAPPSNAVPIAVMGHVSINFVVKTSYSSAPIAITVPPKTAAASR